ncbi:short-chain dehydrogenase [Colletotrichum orchidophilum]|uniref:Short-chain dehydrogenase n=1 Tax=Colletotrichum orchidophilum TaxID=1209926 RepID=A0A1G4B2M8_9PEZI|nr:short-chain dehydrogenase [Colletotrichum orchidophilum]OHE95647.1 short-chain dehydrogenase [Colletotrichum orchidophilum]
MFLQQLFPYHLFEIRGILNSPTVVLITGANGGIGHAIAENHDLTASLQSRSMSASAVQLDLTVDEDIVAAAASVSETFGKLDVLVNNAEVHFDMTKELSVREQGTSTFSTDVVGTAALTDKLLPLLRKAPFARIVFDVTPKAYDASKATFSMLAISYAKLLRDVRGIANAVCPGLLETKITAPSWESANGRLATRFINAEDPSDFLIYIQGLFCTESRMGSWAYLFKSLTTGAVAGRLERLGPYDDLRTPVRHRAELRAALAALQIPAEYRYGFRKLTIATTRAWLVEDGNLLVERAENEAIAGPLIDWAQARNTPEFSDVSDGDLWFAIKRQIQALYSFGEPMESVTVQFRLIEAEYNRLCQAEALMALRDTRRPYFFRDPSPEREW